MLLILTFSINLGWLPTTGTGGWKGLVLPAFTLGFVSAALISRLTRSSLLEVMQEDFVRTAWSKGPHRLGGPRPVTPSRTPSSPS